MSTYDPRTFQALTFHTAREDFAAGKDTPRAYLERCIETIEAREPVVKAIVSINLESAREAADASSKRWKEGRPLSPIDGMPVGVKDLLETRDMPTQMNCEALEGNFPKRDNAAVWALREAGAVPFCKTVTAELGGSHPGAVKELVLESERDDVPWSVRIHDRSAMRYRVHVAVARRTPGPA